MEAKENGGRSLRSNMALCHRLLHSMVRDTRFELVTPTVSR